MRKNESSKATESLLRTKALAVSRWGQEDDFVGYARNIITAVGIALALGFLSVIHAYYDNSPMALLSAVSSKGNYTTESPLGIVQQVNIRYCKSSLGQDHDFLIYEVVSHDRTLTFASPLSVPIWAPGYWKPISPELAASDLRTKVAEWGTYYASCVAGKTDPFGSVAQSVQVLRVDGAQSKHLLKWERNGMIRFNLLVVYAFGIDMGQTKQSSPGFEIPIVSNDLGTHEPSVLVAAIPINAEGTMRHEHIDVNIYHGP